MVLPQPMSVLQLVGAPGLRAWMEEQPRVLRLWCRLRVRVPTARWRLALQLAPAALSPTRYAHRDGLRPAHRCAMATARGQNSA